MHSWNGSTTFQKQTSCATDTQRDLMVVVIWLIVLFRYRPVTVPLVCSTQNRLNKTVSDYFTFVLTEIKISLIIETWQPQNNSINHIKCTHNQTPFSVHSEFYMAKKLKLWIKASNFILAIMTDISSSCHARLFYNRPNKKDVPVISLNEPHKVRNRSNTNE